jgi:hypothetical protein
MKKLLALLIACSMLFLADGCGKQKAAPSEGAAAGPPASKHEVRQRQRMLKEQGGESKTAPAGQTSPAAK